MPSYLPKPKGFLLDRDSNGRYHIYEQLEDAESPFPDDTRPLYAEIEPGHLHRDRSAALLWLYAHLGKQMYGMQEE